MRLSNRKFNQIRPITIKTSVNKNAEGSCLIKCGETHIICTATVEDSVPQFMRKSGLGWVTAEYAMLPRSTNSRMKREASRGKQGGRTLEIQRLIGRSLRACIDRVLLGERQIIIDCDVIQADGGTRCAAITGGWVALKQATDLLLKNGSIKEDPIVHQIAAISCGILGEQAILDLDYEEDSNISTDSNFVMNELGAVIEVQASAEKNLFSRKEFESLFDLAELGIKELMEAQKKPLNL